MSGPVPTPPPPPPEEAIPDIDAATHDAWTEEFDRALRVMADTIETAIDDENAGRIDVDELQRRCLDAGIVRVGNLAVIWDWMNGKLFGYNGFALVELPAPEA